MSIAEDIQNLSPGAIIELFEVDVTPLGDSIYYLHAGTNELKGDVVWQTNTYSAFPVIASGFNQTTEGALPRPKLQIANITGLMTSLTKDFDDLIGVKVTRRRTFVKYLDAVNFTGGTNPDADPNVYFPDDIYFIDRKSADNRVVVEFELASSLDLNGVKLPRRQIIQNHCPWAYKGSECGYAGGAVADIYDNPTSDPDEDACGKRLNSCKLRFGIYSELPYGGYPGSGLV